MPLLLLDESSRIQVYLLISVLARLLQLLMNMWYDTRPIAEDALHWTGKRVYALSRSTYE